MIKQYIQVMAAGGGGGVGGTSQATSTDLFMVLLLRQVVMPNKPAEMRFDSLIPVMLTEEPGDQLEYRSTALSGSIAVESTRGTTCPQQNISQLTAQF